MGWGMRQILLICALILCGCQRLRLEVDDLRLRCGEDANLVDVAQWVEPFSDYGKPKVASLRAVAISKDFRMEQLPISSKGCVAVPVNLKDWEWLSIRSEEAGIFGSVLTRSPERYRRVQMGKVPSSSPRFDCPSPSALDKVDLSVSLPDRADRENLILTMTLDDQQKNGVSRLQLPLRDQEGKQFFLNLAPVREGNYQAKIILVDLLNIPNQLKGFERICPLRIDRTPPQVKLVLRNGSGGQALTDLRLGPGEAVEFKADDTSPTRIMSCWTEKGQGSCPSYVEAGTRLSAPNEGEWVLEYYAVDEAGNASSKLKQNVSIFDADRVGRIVGWIDEARLYLKQESYFEAGKRLYQAAWTMAGLKTESERSYIQEKLRFPFLSLLVKSLPLNKFRIDDGAVIDLWGVTGRTFFVLIDGERRLGRILRLHDLTGKILKELSFDDDAIIRFSRSTKKILVWKPDGALQLYNQELSLETSYTLSRTSKDAIQAFEGNHALLEQANALFHLDLTRPQAAVLDSVDGHFPAAALSYSAEWLVYETVDGLAFKNLKDGSVLTKTYAEAVEDIRFAGFVDTLCIKFKTEIKCGQPKKVLQDEYLLSGSDALGPFAIHPYANVIGYVGTGKVYHYDSTDGSFYFKPYHKKVFSLYFAKELLMLESTDGPLSWAGLPNEAGEPRPYDPELRPEIVKTSTDAEQVFFNNIGNGVYSIVLRAVGYPDIPFRSFLRGNLFNLEKMALLPDQSHLLVLDNESNINIFSTENPLIKAYSVDCVSLSSEGNRCTFSKDGKMQFGEFLAPLKNRYGKVGEFPEVSPYATAAWDPLHEGRLAFFFNNDVTAFEFKDGKPKKVFQREYSKGVWQVKWLGAHYLAISDGYTEIEVWDIERKTKVFSLADRLNVESMFHIPIDYSPILDTFVVIGKGDDSSPLMETWKTNGKAPDDAYQFKDKDMEYAQILRFMNNGKLLMIGFHHGYIYSVKDIGKPLKAGNVIPLKDHQDIVAAIGFVQEGKQAYSISEDGSIFLHKLDDMFSSEAIVKSDYISASGWLEDEQLFWVQYNNNTTVFYDLKGRVVERGDVGLSFQGNFAVLDFNGRALFNWKRFDVWQPLCEWSNQLAMKAMNDLGIEWKSCDVR
jgi:hypothetical protein